MFLYAEYEYFTFSDKQFLSHSLSISRSIFWKSLPTVYFFGGFSEYTYSSGFILDTERYIQKTYFFWYRMYLPCWMSMCTILKNILHSKVLYWSVPINLFDRCFLVYFSLLLFSHFFLCQIFHFREHKHTLSNV